MFVVTTVLYSLSPDVIDYSPRLDFGTLEIVLFYSARKIGGGIQYSAILDTQGLKLRPFYPL